jgi:hypothetical protein
VSPPYKDRGPQIDGRESEDEYRAAVGTRGDLHLVLEERMLLVGSKVNADVVWAQNDSSATHR